jgi:hypothetical protein
MSCGGRRRWWLVPGALVNGGEVMSGGNLGGKARGGGAHREAEVAAMSTPKPTEWRGVWCPIRASRACNVGREGDGARAQTKGAKKRTMGRRAALLKSGSVAWGREEKGGGSAWVCPRGSMRRRRGGPDATVGCSGWPATDPDRRARAAPLPREQERATGVDDAGGRVSATGRRWGAFFIKIHHNFINLFHQKSS